MKFYWFQILFFIVFAKIGVYADFRDGGFRGFSEKGALFKEVLLFGEPQYVNEAYKDLETYFFSNCAKVSLLDWSTFLELTKSYSLFCIRNGNPDDAVQVLKTLLLKGPPKPFIPDLMFILQVLNPQKESSENMVFKLRNILEADPARNFSFENNLLVNTYEILAQDYLWKIYQEISTNFYLNDYSAVRLLCSATMDKIQKKEIFISEWIHEGILADLSRLQAKSDLYMAKDSSLGLTICKKIEILAEYLQKSLVYFEWEEQFLVTLKQEKIKRDSSIDMILLKSGRRLFQNTPQKGLSILESLINFGAYVRNTPTRDALACLLDIYFYQNNQDSMKRLIKSIESSLSIGDALFRDIHFYKGWLLYKEGNFIQAIGKLKQSLNHAETVGKQDSVALLLLGEMSLKCALEKFKLGENSYLHLIEAEKYFLSAYKNWGKEEGALGYLVSVLLQKQTSFSDVFVEPIKFLIEISPHLSYRGQSICRSFLELYSPELKQYIADTDSFFRREIDLYRLMCSSREGSMDTQVIEKGILKFITHEKNHFEESIIELFQDIVSWQLSIELKELSQKGAPRLPWSFLYRIVDTGVSWEDLGKEILNAHDISRDLQKALALYISLRSDSEFLSADRLDLEDNCEFVRFVLLISQNKFPSTLNNLCFENIDYRIYGDEFYFKMYDYSRYLNFSDVKAREHLKRFSKCFPDSDLMPVIFFLLGLGERDQDIALEYFKSSVASFDLFSMDSLRNSSYAYFYYRSCLEYAGKLLEQNSIEDSFQAIRVLEKLKIKIGHPDLTEIGKVLGKSSDKQTLIQYLAIGYLRLFEQECLFNHILEHLDEITVDTNFIVGMLTELEQLKIRQTIN